MKILNHTIHSLFAVALVAAPLAGFAADKTANEAALMQPVKSVYDSYLKIQVELAKDSTKGITGNASAIAKAVNGDKMKMLPADVAKQAETLAKAKNLKAVREAFKPLSASLTKYLADNKTGKGVYHEGYCPMVKAGWLQTEKEVRNPYMGSAMLTCGKLKD